MDTPNLNQMLVNRAPSLYLAGQISGLNWETSTDWRDYVTKEMQQFGIACFSPLRAKSYLRPYTKNDGVIDKTYEQHVLSSQRGIFGRDFNDCVNRDLIFVNFLGATERSIGTAMEIAWGYQARKPIVLVMEEDGSNPNDHAMLREACYFRTADIDEAIWIAKTVLLPVGQHDD